MAGFRRHRPLVIAFVIVLVIALLMKSRKPVTASAAAPGGQPAVGSLMATLQRFMASLKFPTPPPAQKTGGKGGDGDSYGGVGVGADGYASYGQGLYSAPGLTAGFAAPGSGGFGVSNGVLGQAYMAPLSAYTQQAGLAPGAAGYDSIGQGPAATAVPELAGRGEGDYGGLGGFDFGGMGGAEMIGAALAGMGGAGPGIGDGDYAGAGGFGGAWSAFARFYAAPPDAPVTAVYAISAL